MSDRQDSPRPRAARTTNRHDCLDLAAVLDEGDVVVLPCELDLGAGHELDVGGGAEEDVPLELEAEVLEGGGLRRLAHEDPLLGEGAVGRDGP